jgi:nicotinamide riboside kinase
MPVVVTMIQNFRLHHSTMREPTTPWPLDALRTAGTGASRQRITFTQTCASSLATVLHGSFRAAVRPETMNVRNSSGLSE